MNFTLLYIIELRIKTNHPSSKTQNSPIVSKTGFWTIMRHIYVALKAVLLKMHQ